MPSWLPSEWIFYEIVLISTSAILILAFGWLYFSLKGADFAQKLALCMLIFNVFVLIRFICVSLFIRDMNEFLAIVWVLCIMVSLTAFNLGNWYFGFHYFKCSSEMEMIIDVDADK